MKIQIKITNVIDLIPILRHGDTYHAERYRVSLKLLFIEINVIWNKRL